MFNAPWPPLANFATGPDPVGNLSRFGGASTRRVWTVQVTDQFAADTGTLNAWSMLVTPVHFACTTVAFGAKLPATQTVAGSFTVGGTVTYTVTLTNNGSGPQADNAGHEFSETLPAGLTLTGVSAPSGTPAMSGNTVTWNGAIPAGGSVTITITATINSGHEGAAITNQATFSYDADGNGTNESTGTTDDPTAPGTDNPTSFTVAAATPIAQVPTLSGWGLALLGILLAAAAWTALRRRHPAA